VRVADNLDAVRTRLTPTQNSVPLMIYFLRIYQDADLRNAVASNADSLDETRSAALGRARTYSGLENPNGTLKEVMDKATEQSWLHFYSNWIIKSFNIDSPTWSIDVYLWNVSAPLDFNSHPGPGLYQVNRLATSAFSCYVDNQTTFLDLVRFNFDIPIQDVDDGDYLPLKAFTKKPVYTEKGPANWADGAANAICDPYCEKLTVYLTMSPELCLDSNNKAIGCNDQGFAQVPPFTDLSYPTPSSSPSSSSGKKDVTSEVVIIVISTLASILLIATAVLLVVVVRQRSRQHNYEPIH